MRRHKNLTLWEKKTGRLKSSSHFCSTLLSEWVFCRNNAPIDHHHYFIFDILYLFQFIFRGLYSFKVISNKTQTIAWKHEIIKTLTVIKLHITDRKLSNKNICSNIWKAEYLKYIRQVVNFLNIFLNCISKHVIKGALPEIEKRKKLTCESSLSEKHEQNITNKIKQKNLLPWKRKI